MKRQIYYYYRKYILKIAHQKYLNIRKRTYSLEYYLDKFTLILNDYVTWKSLKSKTDVFNFHWLGNKQSLFPTLKNKQSLFFEENNIQ